jgi:hypothetical protein
MPDFYVDDLDISPSDFVDACSKREINELIEILKEDGYINGDDDDESFMYNHETHQDYFYTKALVKLSKSRFRLTNEEEEIIKKIADRL